MLNTGSRRASDVGGRSNGCSRRLLELSMPRASRLSSDAGSGSQSSSRRSTSASRRRGRWFEDFKTDVENTSDNPSWGSSRPSMWEPHVDYDDGVTLDVGCETLRVYPPSDFRARPRSAELPDEELELEYVYGYSGNLQNHIHALDVDKVAYCAAGVAVVMDVQSNKQRIFRGHDRRVTCLAINREKDLAASGQGEFASSGSCYCCIWRVADCSEVAKVHVAASRFDAIEWSQDGKLLLACTSRASSDDAVGQQDRRYEESVHIWNYGISGVALVKTFLLSENVIGMRAHHTDSTRCAVYGADHLTYFSYNPDNADALRIWTPRWGSNGPPKAVLCSVYMPVVGEEEDYSLVVGTSTGEVLVLQGDDVRMKVQHSSEPVTFLQSTPSSICCGGIDGRLCFLNPTSLKPFVYFEMRQAFSMLDSTEDANMCDAAVLVFILDGPRMTGSIVVGTDRNGLWLCNFVGSPQTLDVKPLTLFPGGKVSGLDSNPARSEEVAVATSRGIVRFFDAAEKTVDFRRPFACDQETCGGISCLAFDRAGLLLAIGCTFGRLLLISTPFSQPAEDGIRACNTQELTNTNVSEACITALQWSSNVDWLVVGTADARIYLYCVAMDHVIDETEGGPPRVEVQTVILSSPKVLDGNVAAVTSLQFSVTGDWVMSNSVDGQILFWEMASGQLEKSGFVVRDVVWYGKGESQDNDEDGPTVAQTSWRCPLGWPVAGLWPSSAQRSVEHEVLSVQSSPSSTLCAFGDGMNRVSLVRFPAIRPDTKVKSYGGHSASVTNVRWTSDDTMLTTAGEDGVMLQWRVVSAKSSTPVPRGDQHSAKTAAALEAAIGELRVEAEKRRKTPLQPRGSRESPPTPSNAYSQPSASYSSFPRRLQKFQNSSETPRSQKRSSSLDRQHSTSSINTSRAPSPARQRGPFNTQSAPRNQPTSPRRAAPPTNSNRTQSPYPRSRAAVAGVGKTKQIDSNGSLQRNGSVARVALAHTGDHAEQTRIRNIATGPNQPSSPRTRPDRSVSSPRTRADRSVSPPRRGRVDRASSPMPPSSPAAIRSSSPRDGRSLSNSSRLSSPSPRSRSRGAGQSKEHHTAEAEVLKPAHLITRSTQTDRNSAHAVFREDDTMEQPLKQIAQDVWEAATNGSHEGSDKSSPTVKSGILPREDLSTKTLADIHEKQDSERQDDRTAFTSCYMPSNIEFGGLARAVIYAPESATIVTTGSCDSTSASTVVPSITTVMSTNGFLPLANTSAQSADSIQGLSVPTVTRSHSGPTVLRRPPSGTGSLLAVPGGSGNPHRMSSQALLTGCTSSGGASSVPAPQRITGCSTSNDQCHELLQQPQAPMRAAPSRLQRSSSGSATPSCTRTVPTQLVSQGVPNPTVIRSGLESAPLSARASRTAFDLAPPHMFATSQLPHRSTLETAAPLSARAPASTLDAPLAAHALLRHNAPSSDAPTRQTNNPPALQVIMRPMQPFVQRLAEDVVTDNTAPRMVARTPSEERLLRLYRGQRSRAQGNYADVELVGHGRTSRTPSPTRYPPTVQHTGCVELIAGDQRQNITPRRSMKGAPRIGQIGTTHNIARPTAFLASQTGIAGHM